ncbi:MAG: hypothetical protein M1834_003746 [Cirrosporium novae-zelandiae]|nr:MAG: hypothetical protein M1834_003746 [Cirrosporium novae-zelandiae]
MADIAYDHILQEDLTTSKTPEPTDASISKDDKGKAPQQDPAPNTFNAEFQETFKAIQSSPWGARLGGLWGNVRKQGESYLGEAQKEYALGKEEALKGFTDLRETIVNRTRSLSLTGLGEGPSKTKEAPKEGEKELSEKDQIQENESIINRFKSEAAKRLKDVQRAEDAADEALLKFGLNLRNFLQDAVTIAPPANSGDPNNPDTVLFESQDAEGHRVIHTSRFDAQLHVIHSSLDSFMKDPASPQYADWKKNFNVEEKTEEIGQDLEKYQELRRAMEKAVPEKVEYGIFWCRYYFLRHVIKTEEEKRRELLKGAAADQEEEEVEWDNSDSDSDETSTESSTPVAAAAAATAAEGSRPSTARPSTSHKTPLADKAATDLSNSTSTLKNPPTTTSTSTDKATLKPNSPRNSNDLHSQADSDASYDLVSGATSGANSRAPPSPTQKKSVVEEESEDDEEEEEEEEESSDDDEEEESDEDDWE